MATSERTLAARRALAQHLHRHHNGATGAGTLGERLAAHDDLHWAAEQQAQSLSHTHKPLQDGESEHDLAHRYRVEGAAQGISMRGSE